MQQFYQYLQRLLPQYGQADYSEQVMPMMLPSDAPNAPE